MKWLIDFFKKLFGNTTNTGNGNQGGTVDMNKKAVCCGINDYPGTQNDLQGCIVDCNAWASILSGLNFNVTKFTNSQVTRQTVKSALSKLVSEAKNGDVLAFTYSGHGSFVVDMSSPKPDHKNETIYLYDGNLFDHEIRGILDGLPEGVSMTIIFDSCHSGTATRIVQPDGARPRFMPPKDPAMAALGYLPTARRIFIPEDQMKEIFFAGAKSTEYSYDARFGSVPMGAFSYYATEALKKNKTLTCNQLHEIIRKSLPSSQYPQTPQLEGKSTNKARQIFT